MNIKLIVQRIEGEEHIKIERFNTTRNQNKPSKTSECFIFTCILYKPDKIIDQIYVKKEK
jgi:hypothetical protein